MLKKPNIGKKTDNYKKSLVKKCDSLAREICFLVYRNKCQKPGCASTQTTLQPHHIFTRGLWHVRWDWRNLIPLHPGCHKFWAHKYPDLTYVLLVRLLGRDEFGKLLLLKNTGKFKRSVENLELMKVNLEQKLAKVK